jgi:hypothetical protein
MKQHFSLGGSSHSVSSFSLPCSLNPEGHLSALETHFPISFVHGERASEKIKNQF